MATLPDIAREVGLDPLVCGACGQQVRTTRVLRDLFDLILARLRAGETVKVRGFGTFRPAVHTPRGFARHIESARRVVRFSLTRSAKHVLNRSD